MPILAMDQYGRIYQTSPDRADGLGYGCSPESVPQGDLTLGSAYLKAGAERTAELIRRKRQQDILDHQERQQKIANFNRVQIGKRQAEMEERSLDNPEIQATARKKALAMGCECEYKTSMSGNVMTANGQSGWAGMSRDQQTIHHALTGMGNNTAHRVDPVEAEMFRQNQEAMRIIRLKTK